MEHELITMLDGKCPGHIFTPAGRGRWPGVILFMDGFGIRPTLFNMAQRMADGGYVILLPDLFYRIGTYEPLDLKKVFSAGDVRKTIAEMIGHPTNLQMAVKDTADFVEYLVSREDVVGSTLGATGYCMGGAFSLASAGVYPDRIVAAASFHGGNLVTSSTVSPHLLAPAMKATIYVAAAENDPSYPPEMAAQLEQALTRAGVKHYCEVYEGAAHGWTMPDTPRYNHEAAERHWRELFAFFARTLSSGAPALKQKTGLRSPADS